MSIQSAIKHVKIDGQKGMPKWLVKLAVTPHRGRTSKQKSGLLHWRQCSVCVCVGSVNWRRTAQGQLFAFSTSWPRVRVEYLMFHETNEEQYTVWKHADDMFFLSRSRQRTFDTFAFPKEKQSEEVYTWTSWASSNSGFYSRRRPRVTFWQTDNGSQFELPCRLLLGRFRHFFPPFPSIQSKRKGVVPRKQTKHSKHQSEVQISEKEQLKGTSVY